MKLVEDVILILLMHFLLKHHHSGVALFLTLRYHGLKSVHHVEELIVRQSVLLLSLGLL